MRIKDMPWWNKPHIRLKKKGEEKLDPAQLLSIIIWSGKKGQNAIDSANKLLKDYSFSKIPHLSLTELKKYVDDIGAVRIKAMYEIFKITNWVNKKGFKPTIECAEDIYNYFVDELKGKKKEHFYALLLDSKNRIIGKPQLISVGTLNSSLVHPREVFKDAIKNSANAIILVHNHPSGDCEPSKNDKEISEKLRKTADIVGIKILDHVIVGKDDWKSI